MVMINKLLRYASPLSEQSATIKDQLLQRVVYYCQIQDENGLAKVIDKQSNYNNLVKYLINQGLELNGKNTLSNTLISNGNEKINYAFILHGMNIKYVIDKFIYKNAYRYLLYNRRMNFNRIKSLYFLIKRLEFRVNFRNKKSINLFSDLLIVTSISGLP